MADIWLDSEIMDSLPQDFQDRWHDWIGKQRDPGIMDAYKDKTVKPPVWRTDVLLPEFLHDEYKAIIKEGAC